MALNFFAKTVFGLVLNGRFSSLKESNSLDTVNDSLLIGINVLNCIVCTKVDFLYI